MNTPPTTTTRESILEELGSITQMRRGTLSEQYVKRSAPQGGTVKFGPYFKFQIWQDGRNQTCSVTADEALLLREDIDNFHRFEQLCQQLAQLNIQHTLSLRTEQAAAADTAEKKTSGPTASRKNTAKPKASSPKPARSSSKKKRASKH